MRCDPETRQPLLVFRQELYQTVLGHRKDSAFELLEAVLCAAGPEPLVRLSLAPPLSPWLGQCARRPGRWLGGSGGIAAPVRDRAAAPGGPARAVGDRRL